MNESDIRGLLNSKQRNDVICRDIELRPTNLAMFIAALANNANQSGYIILGVRLENHSYTITGFSKEFKIDKPLNEALALLTNAPKIEHEYVSVEGRYILVIKIENNDDDVFFDMMLNNDERIDSFVKDLLRACVKLQANTFFRNVLEDIRNDYIRDLLSMKGYSIKDQTRRGYSASGKGAGEVDILLEIADMPFAIIEALNLSYLDKTDLDNHLDKIYNYDANGHKFNICLSYVEVKDFGSFWDKYCDYVSVYCYPYDLIGVNVEADADFPYSDIRFMTTTHNRNGKPTLLYHIAIKM